MITKGEEETMEVGYSLGEKLRAGDVVAVYGGFGVGKTVFIKGIVKGLGSRDVVKSPSFVFVNKYQGKLDIFHIDLYRVKKMEEVFSLGIYELVHPLNWVTLIEWADRAEEILPEGTIRVWMKIVNPITREIRWKL
jgi:tRNA threonylcarbamoyladenosine biosynthesis protein TsaE